MAITKDQSTLLPNLEQRSKVEEVFEFLSRSRKPGESIHLSSAASDDDSRVVELPGDVVDLMASVIGSLRLGQGVSVIPHNARMTTQEAADILGVSRPTVIRMIERGELPHEMVGKHRRILFTDVMAYREDRRAKLQDLLAATTLGEDEVGSKEEVLAALAEARGEIAGELRGARQG